MTTRCLVTRRSPVALPASQPATTRARTDAAKRAVRATTTSVYSAPRHTQREALGRVEGGRVNRPPA